MSTEGAVISVLLRSEQYTTALSSDLTAAEGEPKANPGGEPQVWGGTLIRGLLDEVVLLTYPAVVGRPRGWSPKSARILRSNVSTRGPSPWLRDRRGMAGVMGPRRT